MPIRAFSESLQNCVVVTILGVLKVFHMIFIRISALWSIVERIGNLLSVSGKLSFFVLLMLFCSIGSNIAPQSLSLFFWDSLATEDGNLRSAFSVKEGGCMLCVWTSQPSKVPAYGMSAPVVVNQYPLWVVFQQQAART